MKIPFLFQPYETLVEMEKRLAHEELMEEEEEEEGEEEEMEIEQEEEEETSLESIEYPYFPTNQANKAILKNQNN